MKSKMALAFAVLRISLQGNQETLIMRLKYKFWILSIIITSICIGQSSNDYFNVIKKEGIAPIEFVQEKLNTFDLIIFDDALHSAAEPFDFYQELIEDHESSIDYIFIEVFGVNMQPLINAFLANSTKDSTIILKVFQDDFSGLGWRYETYYNLLSTVWDVNQNIQDMSKKIKVIGVNQPIYWEGIYTYEDFNIFNKSLIGRDYFMYKIILNYMEEFNNNMKGIFLTNTRHAYKNIKRSDGKTYWNCGTFFNQWYTNKSYSIRIHNATLSIEAVRTDMEKHSIEGMDQIEYSWIKMENGLWDEAFKKNGDVPIALSLNNNAFGRTKYVGNHMLNVARGQTMFDAYDALIFLAPLDKLYFSPRIDFIYTEVFKKELKRRIEILNNDDLGEFLLKNNVDSIEEYIRQISTFQPKTKNNLVNE